MTSLGLALGGFEAFAPPFPDPMAWALGLGHSVSFETSNATLKDVDVWTLCAHGTHWLTVAQCRHSIDVCAKGHGEHGRFEDAHGCS